jgi:Mitochondrial small ribosomal subunit Rsm22
MREAGLTWDTLDWAALARLRDTFLAAKPAGANYWMSPSDLENYDFTFAQRIAWKWDAVLRELRLRGWTPPPGGPLLDWGCGSGIAGRRVVEFFGPEHFTALRVFDRSPLAMEFAAQAARETFPGLRIEPCALPAFGHPFRSDRRGAGAGAVESGPDCYDPAVTSPSPPTQGGECRGEEGCCPNSETPLPNPLPVRAARGEGEGRHFPAAVLNSEAVGPGIGGPVPRPVAARQPETADPAGGPERRPPVRRDPSLPNPAGSETGAPSVGTLVISHVLNELTDFGEQALREAIDRADAVLWVEPGTYADSRALIEVRERLREKFLLIAPCTHQAACGLRAPENERHWCHHFASPPAGIMADSNWVRFAQRAGIDLRSLPYSFLTLERKGLCDPVHGLLPDGFSRIIGTPRFYKGFAKIFSCQADGVRDLTLQKRDAPELFRALKDRDATPVQQWTVASGRIEPLRIGR